MTIHADSPYRDPAVADVYRRVAVPTHFTRPARDLVTMIGVSAGDHVLDVGSGTGAFAGAASQAAASNGLVVAIDRAAAMLRSADAGDRARRAVAEAPGLPFASDTFDIVGAGFVLAHCPDYSSALADMVRVCRAGGRIGISAWGSLPNEPSRVWKQTVDRFIDGDELHRAFCASVPWEHWFAIPGTVEQALASAGLTAIQTATREYQIEMPPGDYVTMKKAGVEGRLIRALAGESRWRSFAQEIDAVFMNRFPDGLAFVRDVRLAIGTKRGQA